MNTIYNTTKYAEELKKQRRCREMIRKDNLSESESDKLKRQMEACLKHLKQMRAA